MDMKCDQLMGDLGQFCVFVNENWIKYAFCTVKMRSVVIGFSV